MFIYYRWRVSQGCQSTCSGELYEPLASQSRSSWETETVLISCTNFFTLHLMAIGSNKRSTLFFGEWLLFYWFLHLVILEWVFGAKAPDEWFGLCKMASVLEIYINIFFENSCILFPFTFLCRAGKKYPLYNTSIIIYVINLLLVLVIVVLFPYEEKRKILIDITRFVIVHLTSFYPLNLNQESHVPFLLV